MSIESVVPSSHLILCRPLLLLPPIHPIDCSIPRTSVHGFFQTRILDWVAFYAPRALPHPEIKPTSLAPLALQVDSLLVSSVYFSSATQSCLTLCDTTDLHVHHHLQEFTQTHVHRICDAIQPSHPLSSPSPPTLNLSMHQALFKLVSSSIQVAKVLEFQLQHQSSQ